MSKPHLSPPWAFLFGFVCRDLGLLFICLVYVAGFVIFVLSYLSHQYPLALTVALPSSSVFMHHTRRPGDDELDRQVITSGLRFQPIPLTLPHPRFLSVSYDTLHSFTPLAIFFLPFL